MKRFIPLLSLLTLAACGRSGYTATPGYVGTATYSEEDLRAQAEFAEQLKAREEEARAPAAELASGPLAMARRMALASLPPVQLQSMLLGTKNPPADQVLNGNLDQTYTLGWLNNGYPATGTNMLQYVFGDRGSGCQAGNGDKMECWSYHGFVISGGRASTSAPAAITGGGTADFSLEVINTTGGALKVDGAMTLLGALTATSATSTFSSLKVGTSGTAMTLILKQSPTLSFTIGANSCGDLTPGAVTGAALGGACFISAYDTSGAGNGQISLHCGVTSAGNVGIRGCNPTAAGVTVTSKTYSYWLVQ